MYDERHTFIAATPADLQNTQRAQKGMRERLLCAECEHRINQNFETPFKKYWLDGAALASLPHKRVEILRNVDYPAFKLFHLSVLWRASLSSLDAFKHVQLGPHADAIRKMLLSEDPGAGWQYPIACFAMVHENEVQLNLIRDPLPSKVYGQRAYTFRFCGAEWLYVVASHPAPEVGRLCLQQDGTLPILRVALEEIIARDMAGARGKR